MMQRQRRPHEDQENNSQVFEYKRGIVRFCTA